jgi:hypothetical protein
MDDFENMLEDFLPDPNGGKDSLREAHMIVGTCKVALTLPGVDSLKGKRGVLKSLLARLSREFNVTAAEIDHHDVWQSSTIGLALISTSQGHADSRLRKIVEWIEGHRRDLEIVDFSIEIIHC